MTDLKKVTQNGYALEFVKIQTPELCLTPVKQDRMTLKFIKKQTSGICIESVTKNGSALQFVTMFHKFKIEQVSKIKKEIIEHYPELKNMSSEQVLKHFKKQAI